MRAKKCVDHLGNEYKSISEMCKYYGISKSVYDFRLKSGWTQKDALTKSNATKRTCEDHLGNVYSSITEMCKAYNISVYTFKQRLFLGWLLEDAFTKEIRDCSVTDHLGIVYSSIEEMCASYNISHSLYKYRIKNGWTQEAALTTPNSNNKIVTDHLGNCFKSFKEMAEYHGITDKRLNARLRAGYTLEKALTMPLTNNHGVPCKDHLGNVYKSCEEMCKYYNIDAKTYKSRIEDGMSIEAALLTPVNTVYSIYEAVIAQYLDSRIKYENQIALSECRSAQNKVMPFDFSIPDVGLIEVDGEGHFRPTSNWDFRRAVENDTLKTAYCEEHNIPLLRIRYDQMQDGTYIDLIEDFIANPEAYIKQHNKFLSEEEYYAERTANLSG